MSVKCRDIMWFMEDLAPAAYAEEWDNPGLNVGNPDADVKKILVALDATEAVIDEAVEIGADMIITHHPLLFHSVKQINWDKPIGRKVMKLIKNDINMFAAHTNLDAANGGTNDRLAELIGLKNMQVVAEHPDGIGILRTGTFDEDITTGILAVRVKEALGLDAVRVAGNLSKKVGKVTICTGAGMSFLNDVIKEKCDVFITADIRYHETQDALDAGLVLIDGTHYGTENIIVPKVAEYIRKKLEARYVDDVEVTESKIDGQTFVHI